MTDETTEKILSNDNLELKLNESEGCHVLMAIEVTPVAVAAAYKKALKFVNKGVSIPGYRKGRAPEAIIAKNYASHVKNDWKETVLQTAFSEATRLAQVYPMSQNAVKKANVDSISQEDGAVIALEFERYPNVPEIAYDKVPETKAVKREPSEQDLEESLSRVQGLYKNHKPIEDRGVQVGDLLGVTLHCIEGGEELEVFANQKAAYGEAADEVWDTWLWEALAGMKVGELKEVLSIVSPDTSDEIKQAFKSEKHRVTLLSLEEPVNHELDDALAQKLGLQTVEELKQRLQERLEDEAERDYQEARRKEMEDHLLEAYVFDLPATLVKSELETILKSKTLPKDASSEDKEKFNAEALLEAQDKIRVFFLIQRIADKESLYVTNEELEMELQAHAYELAMRGWKNMGEKEQERVRSYFSSMIMERKVKDFLLSCIEVVKS